MITIEIHQLKAIEILSYLLENDLIFTPPMSVRKDLKEYTNKLCNSAIHFCAYHNKDLIAFSASYFNNIEAKVGYVSTLSVVKEFQGKGVAKKLLSSIVEYGSQNGFRQIRLQVNNTNLPAEKLYSETGFIKMSGTRHETEMVLNL